MMLRWMFVTVFLAFAVCGGSSAAAQGLPASVAEPYRDYQSAMEAGDTASALDPAYRAWQAAEAAGIDAETIGLLADNYAALASESGEHERAATAFARSAEILAGTEGGTILTAQTWRLAAREAYRAGQSSATERYSGEAIDILETLPRTAEAAAERYQAEVLRAYREYDRGNPRAAGRNAGLALEALAAVGPVASTDTANMALFAGIREALLNNDEDSAYYFSLANYMYQSAGADEETRMIAEAWSYYARTKLAREERVALLQRLDASGYRPEECADDDEDCGLVTEDPLDFPNASVVEDAQPDGRRLSPVYPQDMAMSGLEGIVLVSFAVDERGQPDDIRVLYSVPHPAFGEASLQAVERWRYTPLRVDGVPTRREGLSTQFIFQLE